MALQKELGLTVDPNVMLVGAVSRTDMAKRFLSDDGKTF